MSDNFSSVFETFNARFMTEVEIADRFVPSDSFERLLTSSHTLIIGPRGSGKTSLLKMLQVRALRAWDGKGADNHRKSVNFSSVFLATDIKWFQFLDQISNKYPIEEAQLVVKSLISSKVMLAFLDTWEARLEGSSNDFLHVSDSIDQEKEMCSFLSALWELELDLPTINNLRTKIGIRSVKLKKALRFGGLNNDGVVDRSKYEELLFPPFMDYLFEVVSEFNRVYEDLGRRWAVCFDELELAPATLQKELLSYLRSVEPELVFKLSMSPFCQEARSLAGMERQASEVDDFNVISLWFHLKNSADNFTSELVLNIAKQNSININTAKDLLGETVYYYVDGSKADLGAFLKHAACYDIEFSNYLEKNAINPEDISDMEEDKIAAKVRKALPIASFRSYYKRSDDGATSGGSRKRANLYAGWESFVAICEGNPRWIIGSLNEMFSRAYDTNSKIDGTRPISTSFQLEALAATRQRFFAKLKTIAISPNGGHDESLHNLVDRLGLQIKEKVFGTKFLAEPAQTFILDTVSRYGDLIERGLNAGAFVYCPVGDSGIGKELLIDLAGKRFRLSYLIASEYNIPLRMGSHTQLSYMLNTKPHDSGQKELDF